MTKAVLEAADIVGRRAKKKVSSEKKEKSPPPKRREHSRGGGVDSDSNLDFLGSLATEVDTIVWASSNKLFAQGDVSDLGLGSEASGREAVHQCVGPAHAGAWHLHHGDKWGKRMVWDSFGQWMWQAG